MSSNRRTWLTTTSSACCVRSGSSVRRASSTSTAADRAVIGDRSSWLTSDANRTSRSILACTASAMSLNVPARRARSGSLAGSRRAPSPPDAISPAASATLLNGRSKRRLVDQPKNVAKTVATNAPRNRVVRITASVRSVAASGNASRYPVS